MNSKKGEVEIVFVAFFLVFFIGGVMASIGHIQLKTKGNEFCILAGYEKLTASKKVENSYFIQCDNKSIYKNLSINYYCISYGVFGECEKKWSVLE